MRLLFRDEACLVELRVAGIGMADDGSGIFFIILLSFSCFSMRGMDFT